MEKVPFLVGLVAAAFPGRLSALDSDPPASGSAGDRLRLRCFGGSLPSAPIVVRGQAEGQRDIACFEVYGHHRHLPVAGGIRDIAV